MRSPKSRCYSLWTSEGMYFTTMPAIKHGKAMFSPSYFGVLPPLFLSDVYFIWGSTLSWTLGMLWIVMTCCSDTCHDWLILVVGLPPFPSWPSTCRSLFRRPAGKMSLNTSSWRVRKTPRSPEKDVIMIYYEWYCEWLVMYLCDFFLGDTSPF